MKMTPQLRHRPTGDVAFCLLRMALCTIGVLALSACASSNREIGGAPDLSVIDSSELPVPGRGNVSTSLSPAYLGPADLLRISVAGVDWLSGQEIRIDANGEMSFPLAGSVTAAGLSPRELEDLLAQRLVSDGAMVNPRVSVNVMEAVSRAVTIEGQVRRPGIYQIPGRISLLQSIALAQGTDEFSRLEDVVIFRTVDDQRYAALYDLEAIRHGAYADPDVYPNDIIMVADERGRRVFKDIIAIVPLITSPLVIAIDRFVAK